MEDMKIMKNKDLLQKENLELMQKLTTAIQENNESAMAEAFAEFAQGVQQRIVDEAGICQVNADSSVLASRGIRQLTTAEQEFYQKWAEAHKSANPRQALVDLEKAMPETIIDSVIDDMKESHPLLDALDFVNAAGAIKMILNADDIDLATWDSLTTTISTELAGKLETLDLTMAKLSAFIPVSKDMIDLGPVWLDNYVRIILSEAISSGLEKSIVKGTGNKQPIGMCKDLEGSVVSGVYTDKTKVVLNSLEPKAYCSVIAPLANKPKGGYRTVPEVLLIVNPVDYITKVIPASTVRATDGTYKNNIFPYPTKTIQSAALSQNEAIIGIGKRYFMAVGAGKSGKVEYSDEYQFLEDNRVYLTKLFGIGRPKDNNAFIYLDITDLAPVSLKVEVTNTESNPVNTKEKA